MGALGRAVVEGHLQGHAQERNTSDLQETQMLGQTLLRQGEPSGGCTTLPAVPCFPNVFIAAQSRNIFSSSKNQLVVNGILRKIVCGANILFPCISCWQLYYGLGVSLSLLKSKMTSEYYRLIMLLYHIILLSFLKSKMSSE